MSFEEIELLSMYRAMTDLGRKAALQQVQQLCKLFKAPGQHYHAKEARLAAANKTKQ